MSQVIRRVSHDRLGWLQGTVGLSGGLLYESPTGSWYALGSLPSGEPLGDGDPVETTTLARVASSDLVSMQWGGYPDETNNAAEVLRRIGYADLSERLRACSSEGEACRIYREVWGIPDPKYCDAYDRYIGAGWGVDAWFATVSRDYAGWARCNPGDPRQAMIEAYLQTRCREVPQQDRASVAALLAEYTRIHHLYPGEEA